ncbi:MAG: hypothetical protein ACR2I0_01435, partial [Rhodoferax sp.]
MSAPLWPAPWLMHLWLGLGWALVTAWLGASLAARAGWSTRLVRGVALTLALWAVLPGRFGSAYWLGLAFQMPSISAVLCCALLLWRRWCDPAGAALAPVQRG